MFGIALEGDMLESFSGELGNMIAGNLSSNIYQQGINMDITPPTVMVGQTKLYGFHKAVLLPVELETAAFYISITFHDDHPANLGIVLDSKPHCEVYCLEIQISCLALPSNLSF